MSRAHFAADQEVAETVCRDLIGLAHWLRRGQRIDPDDLDKLATMLAIQFDLGGKEITDVALRSLKKVKQ